MEAISYWTFTTKRSLSQKYPSEKRLLLKKGPIGTCTAHLLFFDFKLHFDLIYGKAKGQIVMQRFSIMNVLTHAKHSDEIVDENRKKIVFPKCGLSALKLFFSLT